MVNHITGGWSEGKGVGWVYLGELDGNAENLKQITTKDLDKAKWFLEMNLKNELMGRF